MLSLLANLFGGGIVGELTSAYKDTTIARLKAETDEEKLALDRELESIRAARDIALNETRWALNPVSVGRYLIVIPYGLWWAAIFAVSIINPNFGVSITVHALPPQIADMAQYLIPGIILADAGIFAARRLTRN